MITINGHKIQLRKIRLDRQGYDQRGRYYGTGMPLYQAYSDETEKSVEFCARDQEHAKETLKKEFFKIHETSYEGPFGEKITKKTVFKGYF